MFLTKSQKNVLKIIRKSDNTIIYSDLHAHRCFKSDYAVQSAVESLKEMDFITFVVYNVNPEGLTSKSTDINEIIKDRFEFVKYLEPTNRLFITEKGIAYLEETKNASRRFLVPIVISTMLSVIQLFIILLPYILSYIL